MDRRAVRQNVTRLDSDTVAGVGPLSTAEIYVQDDQLEAAAAVATSLSRREVAGLDKRRLVALVRVLLETEHNNGRLFLLLARAYISLAQLAAAREQLAVALELAEATGDEQLWTEAEAEALLLDLPSLEDPSPRLAVLKKRVDVFPNRVLTTHIHEVEALILGQSPVLADIHDAASRLELIANQWELMGEGTRAARTIRQVCSGCLWHLGEYARAAALLDRAMVLVRDERAQLEKINVLHMLMTALMFDHEGFTQGQERDKTLHNVQSTVGWLDAYRSWADMVIASFTSSDQRVRQKYESAKAELGRELINGASGAVLVANAAVCAAVVNDEKLAYEALDALRSHPVPQPLELYLAEVAVEARFATPDQFAEALQPPPEIEIPRGRAWRIDVACHIHMQRHGLEPDTSGEDIVIDAQRFELGDLARQLLGMATNKPAAGTTRVELLGDLRVLANGAVLPITTGKVAELLKLLAVRDRPLPVEVISDHLWPDTDAQRGRSRLRNCINRLRKILGPDSLIRHGDTLSLSDQITTDLREFWSAINTLSTDATSAAHAATLYQGNLLETDIYNDWLTPEREVIRNAMKQALNTGTTHATITPEQAATIQHRLQQN